jgi:hypothetical protein
MAGGLDSFLESAIYVLGGRMCFAREGFDC